MIPKEIVDTAIAVLRKHRALKASIFGSFARGTQNAESDLDLYVELPAGKTLLDHASLNLDLEDALHRKVDVITHGTRIHPIIMSHIEAEQIKIL